MSVVCREPYTISPLTSCFISQLYILFHFTALLSVLFHSFSLCCISYLFTICFISQLYFLVVFHTSLQSVLFHSFTFHCISYLFTICFILQLYFLLYFIPLHPVLFHTFTLCFSDYHMSFIIRHYEESQENKFSTNYIGPSYGKFVSDWKNPRLPRIGCVVWQT